MVSRDLVPEVVYPGVITPSCDHAGTCVRPHSYGMLLFFVLLIHLLFHVQGSHGILTRSLVVLQLHGTRKTTGPRHGTSTESTPPFSYCDSVSSEASPLALGQPLVSFSPPFDAAHVGPPHRHDSTFGQESGRVVNSSPLFGMRIHHPRTSVPVLETLPESPFSSKGNPESIQPPAATLPGSFSRPFLPSSLGNGNQGPTLATDAGASRTDVSSRHVRVRLETLLHVEPRAREQTYLIFEPSSIRFYMRLILSPLECSLPLFISCYRSAVMPTQSIRNEAPVS